MNPGIWRPLLRGSVILAVTFLGGLVAACAAQAAEERPPNVLLIISDDMRPELGCYGVPGMHTPAIDELAARSVQFNRAYVQFPVCNPARTSLLTGRYPTETGVMDNRQWWGREHPDWKTLPRWFRDHGYATLRTGKIFHAGLDDEDAWVEGGERRTRPADGAEGIDIAAGLPPGATEPRIAAPRNPNSDRIVVLDGDGSDNADYQRATRSIEYLRKYADDERPFFLACGFSEPHSPPRAPQRFYDRYQRDEMPLPVDFAPRPTLPAGFPPVSVVPANRDLFMARDASEAEAREMIRAYRAAVSFIDEQVGRVLDTLDELGLRENTIVVFWGDHGYHLGEKGRWSKAYSLFEVADRVPFLIADPRSAGNGQACDRVVESIDLYRTLCDLTGLPAPEGVRGASLAPLLRDPSAPWDRPAFTVMVYRDALGRSVRTERWRYSQWNEGERGEVLFDEVNDPHELTNLAADPRYADTLAKMKGLLERLPGRKR